MKKKFGIFILGVFLLSSCGKSKVTRTDTETSGTALISCDENFSNILGQEIDVYQAKYPDAHLKPVYLYENQIIGLLLKDSIRLAFTYRELTPTEAKIVNEKRTLRSQKIATDGVALIINKANSDSLISMSALKDVLTGKITKWNQVNPVVSKTKNNQAIRVVFDSPGSSIVKYLKDSVCKGENLSPNLRSLKNSEEVLNYVIKNPNSMGVIDVSRISNPNDSTNLSFNDKIRVMSVSVNKPAFEDESYKPFAAYLALGYYPLTRDVFMLMSDVRGGLPSGFGAFVAGDTGQRIILKAGIVPANSPVRLVELKNKF